MFVMLYEVQESFSIKSDIKMIESSTSKKDVDICCSFFRAVSLLKL
jgi:hypothetical protein